MRSTPALLLALVACAAPAGTAHAAEPPAVVVGSKKFTESVVLGELLSVVAEAAGAASPHRRELGGTRILWNALQTGDIDAYVEYTGTLRAEILEDGAELGEETLRARLAGMGVHMSRPLGFDNTYALGLRRPRAEALGLERISQLREHPDLAFGFTNEFMSRADGWPGLRDFYRLPQTNVRGLDHDLAYRALESGGIDLTDLYSTDADIQYYDLAVLEDDEGHFPEYQAVVLHRVDLASRAPAVARAFAQLEGAISADRMVAMNARAKLDRAPERSVAADFARQQLGVANAEDSAPESRVARLGRHTRDHLALVGVSLSAAVLIAIPLGVWSARRPRAGQLVLGASGVLQTIPSLALLVFMIPLLGIGAAPAIAALFLYSLLPIVRNTHAGLCGIPDSLRESAEALGLPADARLRRIELPMAAPAILAGIKTAAVINVGTATLGALIGAGGYGQPILTGIRLDDTALILEGAVPAALLALAVQWGFDGLERWIVPEGLRLVRSD